MTFSYKSVPCPIITSEPSSCKQNTDIHSQKICREWGILEHSAVNGKTPSNPYTQCSCNSAEEVVERAYKPAGKGDPKDPRSSTYTRTEEHMNSQKLWQRLCSTSQHSSALSGVLEPKEEMGKISCFWPRSYLQLRSICKW